jgi:hypothetical protein
MPALPLHTAGPYVAAAYIVFVALILLYVAIMAGKLSRIERELGALIELAQRRGGGHDEQDPASAGEAAISGGRQAP